MQPLSKEQMKTFYEDGYLFIEEFYKEDALAEVQGDVEKMIDNLANRCVHPGAPRAMMAFSDTRA